MGHPLAAIQAHLSESCRLGSISTATGPWAVGAKASLRAATNSVLLPETEPGTLREFFVVPPICGREIAQAERSRVWDREDAFQQFDVGNGLFRVHSISMIHNRGSKVKSRGTGTFVTAVLPIVLNRPIAFRALLCPAVDLCVEYQMHRYGLSDERLVVDWSSSEEHRRVAWRHFHDHGNR